MRLGNKLQKAWNVFMNKDPTHIGGQNDYGVGYGSRPDRPRLHRGNDRSIITSIFNRIALDVSSMEFKHCRTDDKGRYLEDCNSDLNNCLTLEANIDQSARSFIHDCVVSMFDEGCVAILPVHTTADARFTDAYDVITMRTASVLEWKPKYVTLRVYNEDKGKRQDITVRKDTVAIIENPLYAVINEPNSTAQRLMRKLSLLDVTDEQTASGKLNLIIQLPYTVKTESKRAQANLRRKAIQDQLADSKYGIAYTDSTEKITQLNRPLENNLMEQVEYLTNQLFSQLGITQSIMDGTADEKTMLNYYNRTVEPVVSAIVDEMRRKFLSKTARTKGQTIMAFRDPFRLMPINDIAEVADKFTRNEIFTSNEIRQLVGMKPSDDPKADTLINSNNRQIGSEEIPYETNDFNLSEDNEEKEENQNGF